MTSRVLKSGAATSVASVETADGPLEWPSLMSVTIGSPTTSRHAGDSADPEGRDVARELEATVCWWR